MSHPLAYLNGRYLPRPEAVVPVHDAGFVSGATVTDFCRTFRRRPFRLGEHLARFRRGCEASFIPLRLSDDELTSAAATLIGHNGLFLADGQDLAVVFFATPGPIGYYAGEAGGPGDGEPTLGVHTFPLALRRAARFFREGARLVVPNVRQIPAACLDPRVKQRSRMHWWVAEQEAKRRDPLASAVLLDLRGGVTETAAANVLVVRHDAVLSPPAGEILDGVSLRVVRELCPGLGLRYEERPLTPDDCRRADEILLTNTSFCVAGVSRFDDTPIPWPGPVWGRLLEAWSELVGTDVRAQVLAG